MSKHRALSEAAFDRLREQVATATALCCERQMLALADQIHDAIRRHRYSDLDSGEIDIVAYGEGAGVH